MKRANPDNLNTRKYWNETYGDEVKRATYAAQGTDGKAMTTQGVVSSIKSTRFETAVKEVKDKDKVLDIGCGVGVFTKMVKETYPQCEVWGTDISDAAIEANKKENKDISYHHIYIGEHQSLPQRYFDVVFCGETIEHIEDPSLLFREAQSLLKEGGKLIITTPKEEAIQSHEHVWYFTQEDVEDLFTKNGFKDTQFRYLKDMEHLLIIFGVGVKA